MEPTDEEITLSDVDSCANCEATMYEHDIGGYKIWTDGPSYYDSDTHVCKRRTFEIQTLHNNRDIQAYNLKEAIRLYEEQYPAVLVLDAKDRTKKR